MGLDEHGEEAGAGGMARMRMGDNPEAAARMGYG